MTIPPLQQAIQLIEQRTGLNIAIQFKQDLQPMLERLAGGDVAGFVERLRHTPESGVAWQAVIQLLTVSETYFLRDREHFQLLRQTILPSLLLEKRQKRETDLLIWCAGCATGEEPYSVAITLQEFLPQWDEWHITIIGTDINQRALAVAQQAVYRPWSFRHTAETFRKRYFETVENGLQLSTTIRQKVTFKRANLLDAPPVQQCDLIFCRNVLLYLSKEHIRQVEETLFQTLRAGGWLLLGQAEAVRYERQRWHMHIFPGAPIYQKPRATQSLAPAITYTPLAAPAPSYPRIIAPGVDVPAMYATAVEALRAENFPLAEQQLVEVLAQQPQHARAHVLLAFLFASRQALPEAHAQLDTALHYQPLSADAHYLRALLHLEQAQQPAAQNALKAALYCQRQHVLALYLAGNLAAQAHDLPSAQRHWQSAYRALQTQDAAAYVAEFSELTVAALAELLKQQIGE
jgi:chemotaxis protein methyltransferase CheR